MWDWAALVGTAKVLATVVAHLRMCAHQSKLEVLVRTPTSSAVRELSAQGLYLGACAIATPWIVNIRFAAAQNLAALQYLCHNPARESSSPQNYYEYTSSARPTSLVSAPPTEAE